MKSLPILIVSASLFCAWSNLSAAPAPLEAANLTHTPGISAGAAGGVLLAKDEGGGEKKTRTRNLTGETTEKRSGDRTSIDFEAADISGARRTPLGSMVNQNRADKEYDFVKLRYSWHPEMITSAGSLDTKD